MKILKSQLQKIIKEEHNRLLNESSFRRPTFDSSGEYAGTVDYDMGDPDDEGIARLQQRLSELIEELDAAGFGDKLGFAKKFVRDPVDYSGIAARADLNDMIAYLSSLRG